MSVPLAIKKSNSAGTTFEPKFVFLLGFSIDNYIETRTIPFETLQFVAPVSTIFKKNNCRQGLLCLAGLELSTCRKLHGFFSITKTSGPTTKATGSEGLL